jgi:hypothetical protein
MMYMILPKLSDLSTALHSSTLKNSILLLVLRSIGHEFPLTPLPSCPRGTSIRPLFSPRRYRHPPLTHSSQPHLTIPLFNSTTQIGALPPALQYHFPLPQLPSRQTLLIQIRPWRLPHPSLAKWLPLLDSFPPRQQRVFRLSLT